MQYPRSETYDKAMLKEKIMGPNPIKLLEELMQNARIPAGARVMDLGSGCGITSVFLAKEYGFTVYAADLWSDPADNQLFFDEMGIPRERLIPVKADAVNLPFEKDFFDAIVSVDSYNYYGRDKELLDRSILPVVRPGGYLYIAIPGMRRDCHENLPQELLLSWAPEDLSTMHDIAYWRDIVSQSRSAEVISVSEMESNDAVWNDWLQCENPYAVNDCKSMHAGAGKYLNFIAIVLKKKG